MLTSAIGLALSVSALRIALLADIHVTPGNANEQALREAVRQINNQNFDLVIVNGDLSNEGSDAELANVKAILDSIRHPLRVLPGNHESTWSQSATKTFVDIWGNDRFTADLDSFFVVGISCGPFMKMGDGHIKQEDLLWLDKTLSSPEVQGKKILSFNHYPLLNDLDNVGAYLDVLERYPVVAHFNGHYHQWNHYWAMEQKNTIPCVTTRALDLGKGDYGFSEVEIDGDWVKTYNHSLSGERSPRYAAAVSTTHKKVERSSNQSVATKHASRIYQDSASIFTRLAFDKDNIYFGNSLGEVKAISKDGKLRWSAPTGASLFSRATVLKKGIAVPMHDGILILDPKSGRVKTKHKSKEGPYVADGTLTPDGKSYIQGGYKRIECRRAGDGKLQWTYDSIFNYCQAAPAIDGDDLVFGAWDTNLRCLDLTNGKLKWVWNNGKSANMLGPGNVVPVISGDKVFIVAPDRYMTAIDRSTGRTLWRDKSHKYRESLGHSADGSRVYAKTMDGELVAVDALAPDFKELWTIDMGLGYEHAPCIVAEQNGLVVAGSRRGVVSIVDPAKPSLIASLPLGTSEVNGIDIDATTGDVYVSLIEGAIWKINLRD